MSNLALVLIDQRRYDEAEKLLRETLAVDRRVLGPENPTTIIAMGNHSWDLYKEGRFSEAEKQAWYEFACGAAVAGQRNDAFEYLRQAIDHGYIDVKTMASDEDLRVLQGARGRGSPACCLSRARALAGISRTDSMATGLNEKPVARIGNPEVIGSSF